MQNYAQDLNALLDNILLIQQNELCNEIKSEALAKILYSFTVAMQHYQKIINNLNVLDSEDLSLAQENLHTCLLETQKLVTKLQAKNSEKDLSLSLVQANEKQFLFALYQAS